MTYPPQLVDALKHKNAVFVLGAGVAEATCPHSFAGSWTRLIENSAEYLPLEEGVKLLDDIEAAKDADDFILAAQQARTKLGSSFGKWLDATFSSLQPENPETLKAVGDFNIPIFTTNYDKLAESVLRRGTATFADVAKMRAVLMGTDSSIGHLNGVYSIPDTVAFDSASYAIQKADSASRSVKAGLFDSKQIIFVGAGTGISDPLFAGLETSFNESFPNETAAHFRLCLANDVRPESRLSPILDVPYGDSYADLLPFLQGLRGMTLLPPKPLILATRQHEELVSALQEQSLIAVASDDITLRPYCELVVPPLFLPESPEKYKQDLVLSNKKMDPLDPDELLDQAGHIIIVSGDGGSGVTTAITWLLAESVKHEESITLLIRDPLQIAKTKPIERRIKNTLHMRDDFSTVAIGVDNLRILTSSRYDEVIQELASLKTRLTVIGAREEDSQRMEQDLRSRMDPSRLLSVVHLGRFGLMETTKLCELLRVDDPRALAEKTLSAARDRNLPTTPQTLTLLAQLLYTGNELSTGISGEHLVMEFLHLLLGDKIPGRIPPSNLRPHQIIELVEDLARQMVMENVLSLPTSEVTTHLESAANSMGWACDVTALTEFLRERRVLSRMDNRISFSRTTYLIHVAASSAVNNADLKKRLMEDPLAYAPVLKALAAQTRRSKEILDCAVDILDSVIIDTPASRILAPVRQVESYTEVSDTLAQVSETDENESSEKQDEGKRSSYTPTDDSDRRVLGVNPDELSTIGRIIIALDLASCVLRDTDLLRDQQIKKASLEKILAHWLTFIAVVEHETEQSLTHEVLASMADDLQESDDSPIKNKEFTAQLRNMITLVWPSLLTISGITTCLSSPTLVPRLKDLPEPDNSGSDLVQILKIAVLLDATDIDWIDPLNSLSSEARSTFLGAYMLTNLLKYRYITKPSLTEAETEAIVNHVRFAYGARIKFQSSQEKKTHLADLIQQMQRKRTVEQQRKKSSLLR